MVLIGKIDRIAIDAFKASWPCHGLPDDLDYLIAAFDKRSGDLLDYEACDSADKVFDMSEYDGYALVALIARCQDVATDKPLGPGLI